MKGRERQAQGFAGMAAPAAFFEIVEDVVRPELREGERFGGGSSAGTSRSDF